MDNQNIYSGYVFINREVISKLGLNEKPFLRTVYLLMVERANYKTGIVMFSKRFAQSALCIGAKKYYSLLSEMEEMGLIEKQVTGKGKSSKYKIVDYFRVIETSSIVNRKKEITVH
jgi:Cdc6-like AAA superfamily ATPase